MPDSSVDLYVYFLRLALEGFTHGLGNFGDVLVLFEDGPVDDFIGLSPYCF
jgi:hypothetical protein